ncbi:MAG: hypothetical protein PHU25_02815 [Deltaproteobacteria bacterium]|nr:hypothetical protein [Deltaproteobacteria bacterium]
MQDERRPSGSIEIRTPGPEWHLVARALWFGDPWTGTWEWQIRPEDPALRRRLDECFEANLDAYRTVNFGGVSGRRSPGWTSFEGLVGALDNSLPSVGLRCGKTEYPAAMPSGGGVTFGFYDEEAARAAADEEQMVRAARLRGWAAAGKVPPKMGC